MASTKRESALLVRVGEGDLQAFAQLCHAYRALVYRRCRALGRGRRGARATTVDIFASLWDRAARFDPTQASARIWTLALADQACAGGAPRPLGSAPSARRRLAAADADQGPFPGRDGRPFRRRVVSLGAIRGR